MEISVYVIVSVFVFQGIIFFWLYQKYKNLNVATSTDEFIQDFVDSIPAYISWLDKDLKYVRLNKYLRDSINSRQAADILGKKLGYQGNSSKVYDFVKDFVNSDREVAEQELTVCFYGQDESQDFLITAVRIKNSDEILLVSFDVTERNEYKRQAEVEREKAISHEKLATLGEMTAGIAHEINNPLMAINGFSQKILKTSQDPNTLAAVEKILKMTDRIVKITKGLKKISRNDGDSDFTPTRVDEIIEDCLTISNYKIKERQTQVITGNIIETFVDCNPVQISQIIINLINNGLDAIEHFDEKWIRIETEDVGDFVRFRVTDSGKGIPDEVADKMMNAFFTTKAVGKGTGLGLSLSVKIAENHKGKFFIDKESHNTTFVLEIPKEQKTIEMVA